MKKKTPYFWIGLLALIVAAIIMAPLIAPHDAFDVNLANVLQRPNAVYIMGTDAMGRDIFSRILYGGRVSLSVGVFSVMISSTIGIIYGGISGFFGGRLDNYMMRLLDTLFALPNLIIMLALQA